MFSKKKKDKPKPQPLVIEKLEDGQHVVHLPLPQRTEISPFLLGALPDGMIETIITLRFANRQARYRVLDSEHETLICELVQESEGRLPPFVEPDHGTKFVVQKDECTLDDALTTLSSSSGHIRFSSDDLKNAVAQLVKKPLVLVDPELIEYEGKKKV